MRLMLCDDHALFAEAMAAALAGRGHVIVAVCDDPERAVELAGQDPPDVCLMDVNFSARSGLDAAARIRRQSPKVRVVLLTGTFDDRVWAAYESGVVQAVIRKTCQVEAVDRALEQVASGQAVLLGWTRERAVPTRERRLLTGLTGREREVLALIVAGESTAGMAERLGVAESTVRTHVQAVLRKLGVSGRLKAARISVMASAEGADGEEETAGSVPAGWIWR